MGKTKEREKLKVIKDDIEYEFEAAEEGGYIASVPLYPSCVSSAGKALTSHEPKITRLFINLTPFIPLSMIWIYIPMLKADG